MLRLIGVTKSFGPLLAVDNVDLTLESGSITAIVGENGAGKTTLMRVLTGELVADAGAITVNGEPVRISSTQQGLAHGITMVHQHFALASTITVAENVVLGKEPGNPWWTSRRSFDCRVTELAERSGLDVPPSAVTEHLSIGIRQRVEILKALHRDARYLALDEPTAVLTPQESEVLFRQLRSLAGAGRSIVFISHKLPEVLAIADRIVIMRRGRIVGRVDRADASTRTLAALMTGREPFATTPRQATPPAARTVLRVDRLRTHARPHTCAVRDVSLNIRAGEIVGVAAVEGNGQSALLAAIAGIEPTLSGRTLLGDADITNWSAARRRAGGIGHVPEDRHVQGMPLDATLFEAMSTQPGIAGPRGLRFWFGRARTRRAVDDVIKLLDRFDVRYSGVDDSCNSLSGGNQQKAVMAREVSATPTLLLLGQPTRGVDIGAVHDLHGEILATRARGTAVLVVSSDLDELLTLADRIIVMYNGCIATEVAAPSATREAIGLAMTGQAVA